MIIFLDRGRSERLGLLLLSCCDSYSFLLNIVNKRTRRTVYFVLIEIDFVVVQAIVMMRATSCIYWDLQVITGSHLIPEYG